MSICLSTVPVAFWRFVYSHDLVVPCFVWCRSLLTLQGETSSKERDQSNNLASMICVLPNQGILQPYEKIPVFFRFSPRSAALDVYYYLSGLLLKISLIVSFYSTLNVVDRVVILEISGNFQKFIPILPEISGKFPEIFTKMYKPSK